jgi:hypothetical protein
MIIIVQAPPTLGKSFFADTKSDWDETDDWTAKHFKSDDVHNEIPKAVRQQAVMAEIQRRRKAGLDWKLATSMWLLTEGDLDWSADDIHYYLIVMEPQAYEARMKKMLAGTRSDLSAYPMKRLLKWGNDVWTLAKSSRTERIARVIELRSTQNLADVAGQLT